ncbi:MAG: hypothetical protein IPK80_18540 [Nannocystis sp.]|nr:hypothetical protein [Nannocystis sp.]
MSLLRRIFRRPQSRRIELDRLLQLGPGDGREVEVHGVIEALATIPAPTTHEPCVAIEYRAWPESTTVGVGGAAPEGSRAFQLDYFQAVDFVLVSAGARALVRLDRGQDLLAIHHGLLARFGVGLRHELRCLREGDRVGVIARIERTGPGASPMRSDPHLAVLTARRIWRDDSEAAR